MATEEKPPARIRLFWFLFPILMILGVSLACSGLGPAATETPSVAPDVRPTNAPSTAVPPPTNTPKPTADIAATEAARAQKTEAAQAAAAEELQSAISAQLAEVNLDLGNGHVVYSRPEEYEIHSSDYNTIRWSIIDNSKVGDFAIHANIGWESEMGFAGCGFVFRVGEDTSVDPWYDLIINRLSGLPYAFFDIWKGDYVQAKSNWYPSSAIKFDQGDTNEVILTGKKSELTVYVNRKKIAVWWNAKQVSGSTGFAVYANSGLTTCKFTDTWIWEWDK